eukprot:8670037-Alexandrium_andersonii.AAC.1
MALAFLLARCRKTLKSQSSLDHASALLKAWVERFVVGQASLVWQVAPHFDKPAADGWAISACEEVGATVVVMCRAGILHLEALLSSWPALRRLRDSRPCQQIH